MKLKPGLEKEYRKFKATNSHDKFSFDTIRAIEKMAKHPEDKEEITKDLSPFQKTEALKALSKYYV